MRCPVPCHRTPCAVSPHTPSPSPAPGLCPPRCWPGRGGAGAGVRAAAPHPLRVPARGQAARGLSREGGDAGAEPCPGTAGPCWPRNPRHQRRHLPPPGAGAAGQAAVPAGERRLPNPPSPASCRGRQQLSPARRCPRGSPAGSYRGARPPGAPCPRSARSSAAAPARRPPCARPPPPGCCRCCGTPSRRSPPPPRPGPPA